MKSVLDTEMLAALRTQHLMEHAFSTSHLVALVNNIVIFEVDFFRFWRQFTSPRKAVIVEVLTAEDLATFALEWQEVGLTAI